jgi:plastocyanin
VMAIDYNLKYADGAQMQHVIHKTIHRVAGDRATANLHSRSANRFTGIDEHSTHAAPAQAPAVKFELPLITDADRIIEIQSTGIALSYDITEIRAKPGERLAIRFLNASDMAHNIVIVKSESDIHPVGVAAISAQADEFVPKKESHRILAASRLAYPGDTVQVEFTAPGPGTYPYICTFSGHFTVMQGRLIVE